MIWSKLMLVSMLLVAVIDSILSTVGGSHCLPCFLLWLCMVVFIASVYSIIPVLRLSQCVMCMRLFGS